MAILVSLRDSEVQNTSSEYLSAWAFNARIANRESRELPNAACSRICVATRQSVCQLGSPRDKSGVPVASRESLWQRGSLCRSWLQPRHNHSKLSAASAAEVQVLQLSQLHRARSSSVYRDTQLRQRFGHHHEMARQLGFDILGKRFRAGFDVTQSPVERREFRAHIHNSQIHHPATRRARMIFRLIN